MARLLVLVDLARNEAATLAGALGISRYEAGLLARRGGLHLVKPAAPEADAAAEAERSARLGAAPLVVPEAEVRAAPVPCLAGELRGRGPLAAQPAGVA